jgi:Type II secretion system (T2SS), protein M subtype b
MKWTTMSLRDRRAVLLGAAVLLPALAFIWGVRPYMNALDDARSELTAQRDALAREQAAVTSAKENPRLRQLADSAMQAMQPKLFSGRDDVMASALLASYVGDLAAKARVWLQDANTRPAVLGKDGVRALQVDIRGQSDLRGTMRFLQALQRGSKLIRVDKLDVSHAAGSSDDPMETLTITATISGFALADASGAAVPDSASKRGQ